ncbi:hypothetical protein [Lacipirellula sp.]|uniref:hypothetical protein n=1 Tax=Lacipirellula sp. TaxID=2691419 RepID=UPI003D102A29
MELNPRLNNVVRQKNGHLVWHAPDRDVRIPDIATANRILDRIDTVRRSPVSDRALILGVTRPDDRSREQRVAEDGKTYRPEDYDTWFNLPSEDNPHLQSIADLDSTLPTRKTIREQVREHYQRQAEEWEEKQSAPAAEPAQSNWKWLTQAAEHFLVATYSETVPLTVHRQTGVMLAAAEAGDRATYSVLHREFAAAAEARYAAADSALALEQARIMADRQSLGDADFDFPTTGEQSAAGSNTTQQEQN